MEEKEFIDVAKTSVCEFYKNVVHKEISEDDVFIVWSCKTLQNRKAILATHEKDHYLFELTLNGDKQELYLDAYDKVANICMNIID